MPAGIQFDNLNRYRRYPFRDFCGMMAYTPSGGSFILSDGFARMFRIVVVHAGDTEVSDVRLLSASRSGQRKSVELGLYDKDGNRVPLRRKGKDVPDGVVLAWTSGSDCDFVSFDFSDFDFATCISVSAVFDFSEFPHGVDSFSCSLPFATGVLLSMQAPHVMSVMDDCGNPVRNQDYIELVEGYNTKIHVIKESNTIIVSALKGGGAGLPCGESGLAHGFSSSFLCSLNGVAPDPSGNILISGGRGLNVKAFPGYALIDMYSEEHDADTVKCEMS